MYDGLHTCFDSLAETPSTVPLHQPSLGMMHTPQAVACKIGIYGRSHPGLLTVATMAYILQQKLIMNYKLVFK